jgi:hypothetical protein
VVLQHLHSGTSMPSGGVHPNGYGDGAPGDRDDAEEDDSLSDAAWLESINQTRRTPHRRLSARAVAGVGSIEDIEHEDIDTCVTDFGHDHREQGDLEEVDELAPGPVYGLDQDGKRMSEATAGDS